MDDLKGEPSAPEILEGWVVELRSYGIGTCMGGRGQVLCRGKWGVIGATGNYRILHPNGWIEETPRFDTEVEAMLWVMERRKANAWNEDVNKETRKAGDGEDGP